MGRVPGLRTAGPSQISLCTEACRPLSLVCLGPKARGPALAWLIWAARPTLWARVPLSACGGSCGSSALLAEPGDCPGGNARSPFPGAPSPQELPLCYLPAALHPRLLRPRPSGMALCSAGCLLPPWTRWTGPWAIPGSVMAAARSPGRSGLAGLLVQTVRFVIFFPVLFLPFPFLVSLDRQDLQPEIGVRSGRQDPGSLSCQCPQSGTCELCDKGPP